MTTDNPNLPYFPCKITNNSGKDVLVLQAMNHSDATTFETYYEQELTTLTLASGGTVLANGKTDTVFFTKTITVSGTIYPLSHYDLIFADPSNLQPIGTADERSTSTDPLNPVFPDITIADTDASKYANALYFVEMISAYPSSTLAQNFVAALKAAGSSLSPQTEATMNKFFAGTIGFTDVDFPAYLAATTYIDNFAANWVPPETDVPYNTDKAIPEHKTYSYWLYAESDMGGDTTTDSGRPIAQSASCSGVVVFKDFKGSKNLDSNDSNSGWTIVFSKDGYAIDGGTSVTNLTFHKGQFVDTISDIPSIALKGMWSLEGTFSGDATDTTLYPTLVGNVGGVKMIGIPMRPEDGWDKFAKFWQGLTFLSVVNNFLMIMGVIMAIDFIKTKVAAKVKSYKETKAKNNGKEPDATQEKQIQDDANNAETVAQGEQEALAKNMGNDPTTNDPNVTVPNEDGLPVAQQNVKASQSSSANQQAGDNYRESLKEAQGQVDALEQLGDNDDLEAADIQISVAKNAIPADVAKGDFTDTKASLDSVRTTVNETVQNSNFGEETIKSITDSQNVQNTLEKAAEKVADDADTIDGDGTPETKPFDPVKPPVVDPIV